MKKLHIFLGFLKSKFSTGKCCSSYSSQNVLKKHNQRFELQEINSFKTSNESHLFWKSHFQKDPLYFCIYADFKSVNEIDNSNKFIKDD